MDILPKMHKCTYYKISNIRAHQLPEVLRRQWSCSWSSADRRCSNYIWVIDNLIAYEGDVISYPCLKLNDGLVDLLCKTRPRYRELGATARSYRRQDGADAAARFEKFLPARASLRPPISLKFTTERHGGMVHLAPKRRTRAFSLFRTIIPGKFAARRR